MVNANGKEDTAFTVQYDFVMPKRFDLKYIDENGQKREPVVIHRSSIGAIERTIAFLIEKYRGAFPTWLSPIQVKVLPITERNLDFSRKIVKDLKEQNIRTELDDDNETLGNKIRKAQKEKANYMLIIGDKEEKAEKVAVRTRDGKDLGQMKIDDLLKLVKNDIIEKSI